MKSLRNVVLTGLAGLVLATGCSTKTPNDIKEKYDGHPSGIPIGEYVHQLPLGINRVSNDNILDYSGRRLLVVENWVYLKGKKTKSYEIVGFVVKYKHKKDDCSRYVSDVEPIQKEQELDIVKFLRDQQIYGETVFF
ncbi:hypothetical protein HYX18_00960 [Candidatus Woesearchaeota archaeon]|nr:hypothetical protein [Candidatus Woesearchaeota archaeon]